MAADWKALPAVPGNPGGLAVQKATAGYLQTVFTNFKYKVLEVIDGGADTVVARAQLSGIQAGNFLGIEGTRKQIVMDTIEVHKVCIK